MYIPMAGQGASRGLRALLSSPKARVTSRGSWAAPQSLGAPAANPSSPGAAAGSRRLCWSDNPHPSAGCGDPLGPAAARQLPAHGRHTLTHTDTHTHAPADTHTREQTRTNPPGQPEQPQEPAAKSSPSARWEERAAEGAGDPAPSSQIPAGKAPPEAKKQSELQGNADSNAEIFFPPPFAWKKKIASHNWRRKKKKSICQWSPAWCLCRARWWLDRAAARGGEPGARHSKADDGLSAGCFWSSLCWWDAERAGSSSTSQHVA